MKKLIQKLNKKQNRWVKEEFRPYREKHAIKMIAIGFFLMIATFLAYLNIENYPYMRSFYTLTVILGVIFFGIGIFFGLTGFKMLYKLDEVTVGKLVCYHYVKDSKSQTQIFESVSDAEMQIENPKSEEEEEEDVELEPMP